MWVSFRSSHAALLASVILAAAWPVGAEPAGPNAAASAQQEAPLQSLPNAPSLDLTSMDTGADACTDFYRFSCGGWIQRNPIPGDEPSWSVYGKLQDDNQRFLWGLLQTAAEPTADRPAHVRKAGDAFAACMAAEAAATTATSRFGEADKVSPTLEAIAQLRRTRDLAPLVARLHALGAADALFAFGSAQDPADSSRVVALADAAGIGLPDRDYYLARDAKGTGLRRAYQDHIAATLALAGATPDAARRGAAVVLGIETALAKASLTREQRRDPHRIYHPMRLDGLQRLAPAFDWQAYFDASGVPAATALNVTQPGFVRGLNTLLASQPIGAWQTYLRWHLLRAESPSLSGPMAAAHFDFYGRRLQGLEAMPPRWKQCVQWVDRDLGDALGQLFVERSFDAATRERVQAMTARIETAMHARIEALDWMSPATKLAALEKLAGIVNKIGYPDRWRDYGALRIERDDFLGNVQRSAAFERQRQLAKIGKPVDRSEWGMTPPTVNAYYDPQMNDINFPAGVLQPPLYSPQLDAAPNYGDTGATIGHELTHGFDDEGRQFDAKGNLRDWWTRKDAAAFKQRTQCIVDQYSQVTIVDDLKINGRLTLGEDVADLGGTILAYAAWQAETATQRLMPIDGYTPEQRFFIGMAQWACGSERPERLRLMAITDPHSPPSQRVNGVVANMPEFARAFACKPGQPMVREQPCKVW